MRRFHHLLAVAGLIVWVLAASKPAYACEQCQRKLRCIGDECWTEYVCVGNLRYPQRGWPGCDSFNWGCEYDGPLCQWTRFMAPADPVPFLRQNPVCTQS